MINATMRCVVCETRNPSAVSPREGTLNMDLLADAFGGPPIGTYIGVENILTKISNSAPPISTKKENPPSGTRSGFAGIGNIYVYIYIENQYSKVYNICNRIFRLNFSSLLKRYNLNFLCVKFSKSSRIVIRDDSFNFGRKTTN